MNAGGTVTRLEGDSFAIEAWILDDDDGIDIRGDIHERVELNRFDSFLLTAGLELLGPLPSKPGETTEVGPLTS